MYLSDIEADEEPDHDRRKFECIECGTDLVLQRGYRPKPRLVLMCLWVAHDAPDYRSARVTEPHSVRVVVISEKFPLWNHLMRKLGFLCFF
jgi:hypothetical protein